MPQLNLTSSFFDKIKSKLLAFGNIPIVSGADINLSVGSLDRSAGHIPSSTLIMVVLNIVDAWCILNP